jgi:TonB family protein
MKAPSWLPCWVCVSCAASQQQRATPGEFAGPSVLPPIARSTDAGAPLNTVNTAESTRASNEPATPPPAPNTSIEPSQSQGVCDAAIAASRATTSAAGAPVVQPGASVTGLLSPEQIRRTTLRNLGQISSCHERWLAYDPRFEGRVLVRFVIGSDGAVIAATVAESATESAFVRQCIVNAIRGWRFDAPRGGGHVTVNYPFNLLRPAEDAESQSQGPPQANAPK